MIEKDIIDYAADGTAWKSLSMMGYVMKKELPAATYGEGAYALIFVKRNATNFTVANALNPANNESGVTRYYMNIDPTKAAVSESDAAAAVTANGNVSLVFDFDLLKHILADNWNNGTASDFETARSGSGTW